MYRASDNVMHRVVGYAVSCFFIQLVQEILTTTFTILPYPVFSLLIELPASLLANPCHPDPVVTISERSSPTRSLPTIGNPLVLGVYIYIHIVYIHSPIFLVGSVHSDGEY